jgi:putative transferase (TIGR04331 family)
MFLAITANSKFWDKNKELLFLGEWCKLYSSKKTWNQLSYKTLDYHWNDRTKLFDDYMYIESIYKYYLEELSKNLNRIHNINKPISYWRIIIGWWLRYFIEVFFDRYQNIINAENSYEELSTWIIDSDKIKEEFTPYNLDEFSDQVHKDDYNLYLFSFIIKNTNRLQFSCKEYEGTDQPLNKEKLIESKFSIRKIKTTVLNLYFYLFNFNSNIIFHQSYFGKKSLIKLQLKLGKFPNLELSIQNLKNKNCKSDRKKRKALKFEKTNDEFRNLLNVILQDQIPLIYFEDYTEVSKNVEKITNYVPKIIFTSNSHFNNDYFKIWTAKNVEKGTKLVIGQHGGHFGSGKFNSALDNDLTISDKYVSWGWGKKDYSLIKGLPANKLICLKPRDANHNSRTYKRIHMILSSYPRYSYRLYSIPFGPAWLETIKFQSIFVKHLSKKVQNELNIRPYMNNMGWDEAQRFKDQFPDISIDNQLLSWRDVLNQSKLNIETNNQTTFLESLACNIPTVLVLQEKYWEMEDDATNLFLEMKKVGMYFTDAKEAASFVNDISKNPLIWWEGDDVQDIKNRFCQKYAKKSKNWIKEWALELNISRFGS